jgi:beta-mannosidase
MNCRPACLTLSLLLLGAGTIPAQAVPAQRVPISASAIHDVLINTGWEFHALDAPDHPEAATWRPATVPGVVLTDLLAANAIPDPFHRDNEARLQWIGLIDWEYRNTLNVSAAQLTHRHVELVFDGLDTFSEVYLNGQPLLQADNMFRSWRAHAKPLLHPGANQIRVVFHSAVTSLLPQVKAMDVKLPTVMQVQAIAEEGIATDPYVRKAPYSFGWDWGPRFVNEGIWKDVHLVTWDNVRIGHLHIAQPRVDAASASIEADLDMFADHETTATMSVDGRLMGQASAVAATHGTRTVHLAAGENTIRVPLEVVHPRLWNPVGYGAQSRYEFRATLSGPGFDETTAVRTGLRSVELRRTRDDIGRSFFFVVNGKPVFAKGADVIPFDSFAPRVTAAQHRQILQSAVDAHMNMVREWGGGYYETDDFYDIADELGILVWQEFMFGGAQIPGGADFRDNVRQEAIEQVERLRDHPSIVLWCGNNEVETGWFHWGDRLDFKKKLTADQQQKVWQDYLLIMDDVLKSTVAQHSPETPYTPSSPHAEYDQAPDIQTAGDMHYWAVWGQTTPVAEYNNITPRFMSEYGFQSFPEMRTIASFAEPGDEQLTSPVMMAHQKNGGGNERIKKYMDAEYPTPRDFASFVYVSQVQQAEAIRTAAEHLRSARPRTMGSLYWQLNDCWPGPSWASIDYFGRWKALQFYAKKFYADLAVAPYLHDGVIDTTIISDLDHPVEAMVSVSVMGFDGQVYSTSDQTYSIPAASAKRVSHMTVASLLGAHPAADTLARFVLTVDNRQVADRTVYFDHVRNLRLPAAAIETAWSSSGGRTLLTLHSSTLARNVWIGFDDLDVQLSDNSFDLLPGIPLTVEVKGSATRAKLERNLKVMSLRDAFDQAAFSASNSKNLMREPAK